jgi:hypothetical protein
VLAALRQNPDAACAAYGARGVERGVLRRY